jgi:hypothetical protein
LIPQEDYFVDQLLDITAKFNGHYMTKMLKQVKAEKDALEKIKTEQVFKLQNLTYGID